MTVANNGAKGEMTTVMKFVKVFTRECSDWKTVNDTDIIYVM